MRIFISWSGGAAQRAAQGLCGLLRGLDAGYEPWTSDQGIAAGQDWRGELHRNLRSAEAGILCITRAAARSEWINFEAGAMSVVLPEGHVFPLLVDIEHSALPATLQSIQSSPATEAGTRALVARLHALKWGRPPEAATDERLMAAWPAWQAALQAPQAPERRPLPAEDHNRLDAPGFDHLLRIHFAATAGRIRQTVAKALADAEGAVGQIDYGLLALSMMTTLREGRALLAPFHFAEVGAVNRFLDLKFPESELHERLTRALQLAGNCRTPAQLLTLVEAMIADEQVRLSETLGSRLQPTPGRPGAG